MIAPDRQLLLVVLLFGILIIFQEYRYGSTIDIHLQRLERDVAWILPRSSSSMPSIFSETSIRPQKHVAVTPDKAMAACLMVRDDNALLHEWLAYHYVTLPLRNVLVGADQNSTENPQDIMNRWNDTDMKYIVWNADDFMYRFGPIPVGLEDQNHHYLHRQRAFLSSCAEYMKAQNETWVVFVDTDEFVAVNRINKDDEPFEEEEMETNSSRYERWQQRQFLDPVGSTVMDAIQTSNQVAQLEPCHIIPRLLIGALENETCPEMDHVKDLVAAKGFEYSQLSSIRFIQTAPKNSFYPSKWGKVMVDVSRMTAASLATKPRSSHRPFRECPKPLRAFEEAIVHANHYLGSWERYSARQDVRRSRGAFEERAYFSHGLACEMHMEEWFVQFVDMFGVGKAKFLLGLLDSSSN